MPVGMNPSGLALPGAPTWKTATLLASALARNSTCPSGVRLTLLGVLPGGTLGCRAQLIVSIHWPLSASSTLTRVELAQATNRCLPSGDRSISVGCFSVFHDSTT